MKRKAIATNVRDGVLQFICAICFRKKDINIGLNTSETKVRCECGHVVDCIIERRKSKRKKYAFGRAKCGKMVIYPIDISFGGMKFSCENDWPIPVGKKINIEYVISRGCPVRHAFFVKNVYGKFVGVQYVDGKNHPPHQRLIMST